MVRRGKRRRRRRKRKGQKKGYFKSADQQKRWFENRVDGLLARGRPTVRENGKINLK